VGVTTLEVPDTKRSVTKLAISFDAIGEIHNLDLVAGLAVGGGAWECNVCVGGGGDLELGKRFELDLELRLGMGKRFELDLELRLGMGKRFELELRLGIGSTFSRTTPLIFPSTTSGRPQLFHYVRVRVRVRVRVTML
jgi:hypothetical protein